MAAVFIGSKCSISLNHQTDRGIRVQPPLEKNTPGMVQPPLPANNNIVLELEFNFGFLDSYWEENTKKVNEKIGSDGLSE